MFYDCSCMNIVIPIHSPGAMGSAISAPFVEHGAHVLTSLDGRSAATVERAGAAGMQDASPETITTADIILSIVPPGGVATLAPGKDRARHNHPGSDDCTGRRWQLSARTPSSLSCIIAGG
jgi:hypothetical protein